MQKESELAQRVRRLERLYRILAVLYLLLSIGCCRWIILSRKSMVLLEPIIEQINMINQKIDTMLEIG